MSFKIKSIVVGPIMANCFVVWDTSVNEGIVIDPGDDAVKIMNILNINNIKIKYIVNTHGHIDHIGANPEIKEKTGAKIGIHENDVSLLGDSLLNGSDMLRIQYRSHNHDFLLEENKEYSFGNIKFVILHTPGHTQGGVSVYFESEKVVFTGDTLFSGSIGRTDLPGGNYEQIIRSIKNKLFTLPEDVIVFPGHGESTNISEEKFHNVFFN